MEFLNKNNQLNIKEIESNLKACALKANFKQKDVDYLVNVVLDDLTWWFEYNRNITGQEIYAHVLGFLEDINQSPDLINQWKKLNPLEPLSFKEEMDNPYSCVVFIIVTLWLFFSVVMLLLYFFGKIQISERVMPIFLCTLIGVISFIVKQIFKR